jgi:hypothetical protein
VLGHIYIGGQYGDNRFLGAQYDAQQQRDDPAACADAATDTAVTNIVTGSRAPGTRQMLSTTPAQTASASDAANALGLDVPGQQPVFDPASKLAGPAAASVGPYVVASSVSYSAEVASEFDFSQAGSPPSRPVYIAQADPGRGGRLRPMVEPFTSA